MKKRRGNFYEVAVPKLLGKIAPKLPVRGYGKPYYLGFSQWIGLRLGSHKRRLQRQLDSLKLPVHTQCTSPDPALNVLWKWRARNAGSTRRLNPSMEIGEPAFWTVEDQGRQRIGPQFTHVSDKSLQKTCWVS